MRLQKDGVYHARLRCPETNRWRIYELDAALDVALVQRLNDLAFVYGTEIVSLCAGHDDPPDGVLVLPAILERSFAEARFAIFFPSWDRLAAQQARVCIEVIARACAEQDTVIETLHERDVDRRSRIPRERRHGRSLVAVRHNRPTAEAPALAQEWWHRLVARLDSNRL